MSQGMRGSRKQRDPLMSSSALGWKWVPSQLSLAPFAAVPKASPGGGLSCWDREPREWPEGAKGLWMARMHLSQPLLPSPDHGHSESDGGRVGWGLGPEMAGRTGWGAASL